MTDMHHISDEQLGKEIGYLVGGRVEAVTAPAGVYLAIEDRLGEQDSTRWSPSRLLKGFAPGSWRLPLNSGTFAKVALGVIVAAALITVLIWQGRDTDQGLQPAGDPTSTPTPANDTDVPNLNKQFDLSGLDAAATEAEIIRLLGEGHVMYTRQTVMSKSSFEPGGVFMRTTGCIDLMRSIPQVVCEGYPETVVEEWWESVDSSGTVDAYFGRISTLGGIVLATGVQGEWTDIASGEEWSAGRREGRELVRDVETTFSIIEEKEARYLVGTESEFAGRPSLIFRFADEYAGRPNVSFNDGDSEYQVANPFFRRIAGWHDDEDGTRNMRSEITVLDFAMLPPGSLPRFAIVPLVAEPNVPNLSERADLEGMDTAAIQAEFIRLLAEGHVLYQRMERFALGGAYNGLCGFGSGPGTSMPQPVCDNYPGRIVRETWESTDSSGLVQVSYGRESKLDGTVLAIKVEGVWTDIASGESWPDGMREDFNLIDRLGGMSTTIERGMDGVESEYLGKPSIIFGDVFEYQIENPMLWRQVRRQELGDGMQTILSEARFTDVAMLPPESFPEFATPEPVDRQVAEIALLDAHRVGTQLGSYSSNFKGGIGARTLPNGVSETDEYHRPDIGLARMPDGSIAYLRAGTKVFTPNQEGMWCSEELGDEMVDWINTVPESLDRITRSARIGNGNLLIEGFALHPTQQVNKDYPATDLHRMIIDSAGGYVLEWTYWGMFEDMRDELQNASDAELMALAEVMKGGDWSARVFSNHNALEPVGIPTNLDEDCSVTSASTEKDPDPTPRPEPTSSFTVNDLNLEPLVGTVFETLLSKMPDNEITRGYTRLGDVVGAIDALGFDRPPPGSSTEARDKFARELAPLGFYIGFNVPVFEWPADQLFNAGEINTYPDLAFDWASVDQFAQSDSYRVYGDGPPIYYDVALGSFDPAETTAALAQCDCDQPIVREYNGIEYLAWSDGKSSLARRNARPFYDHLGRGPHLLVRNGEAYYSLRNDVIDEHIDLIQGATTSLAEIDDYVSAVQWIASMGIVSEITLRNQGFTVDEVVQAGRGLTAEEIVQDTPLLAPFTAVATGIGNDRERMFFGLVIVHEDAASAEKNVERLLTRIRNVTVAGIGSGLDDEWSLLVDQIDVQTAGQFLVARIYLNNPGYAVLLNTRNTLLVHE